MKENSILFSILLLLQLIYKYLIIKFIQHTTGVLARLIRQENKSSFPNWKLNSLSHVWLFVTPWIYRLPGSSVHGSFRARILEWVAIYFSRGSSWPRDWTQVSCTAGGFLTIWATREAPLSYQESPKDMLHQNKEINQETGRQRK